MGEMSKKVEESRLKWYRQVKKTMWVEDDEDVPGKRRKGRPKRDGWKT